MAYWINTVSRDHVARGVAGGFTQANHGKPHMLRKMARGDWIVFYSPRTTFPDGPPLQAFTALGRISPGALYESAHEIKIRNQKDTPVTVRVVEPLGGEWTMVETSIPNRKTAAFESQWDVPVPAGGETVLTYRVRVKY